MSHSSGQTEENKRILKELEDQKRKFAMKSQHNIPSSGIPVTTQPRPITLESALFPGASNRHSHNRQALHEAQQASFGYFVSTDSQFGNPILAVLPRLEPEKKSPL
ncbi:INIP [Bugula neritina]|uniref:INIP n=1 Tax=Bugula neritina TaxID=10212 RepID=A0A7J7JIU8_BUGNE|nr:INIP [Bugula neritina]KAF6025554.1 INIP [Bugula neritina]